MSILIETTLGDFVVDLYIKERPRTCMNFLKLCKVKYYNYTQFYSIQRDFTAQAGDPTNTGRGGFSIFQQLYGEQAAYFEMESLPKLKHLKRGTLSMVNNGQNLHGSQFFLTLRENLDYLDDKHTIFGELAEGFETLEKLNESICDDANRPYRDIWITHTIILDDPFPDPSGLDVPARSPSPSAEILQHTRIAVDEEIDDTVGKTEDELREELENKEATARAHILEMVGDLHYAEERPPDNVLFVCKLNPVTTEDDLAIIFGRFGKILSCEIIRDQKTGNSLQYAFIEFDRVEDCETAYFKMDNVLIDDRRIHVDFSQSVSKNFSWRQHLPTAKRQADLLTTVGEDGSKVQREGKSRDRKRSPARDSSRKEDGRHGRKEEKRRSPSGKERTSEQDRRKRRHSPSPREYRKEYWRRKDERRSPSPGYKGRKHRKERV